MTDTWDIRRRMGDPSDPLAQLPGETNKQHAERLERDHPEVWDTILSAFHGRFDGLAHGIRQTLVDAEDQLTRLVPQIQQAVERATNDRDMWLQMEQAMRLSRERATRGYNLSDRYLSTDHPAVTSFMGWLDYGAFLDAQASAGEADGLVDDLRRVIDAPQAEVLRRAIAWDILRRSWADTSAAFAYYGDGDARNDRVWLDHREQDEREEVVVTGQLFTDLIEAYVELLVTDSPTVDITRFDEDDGIDFDIHGERGVRQLRNHAQGYMDRGELQAIWDGFRSLIKAAPAPTRPHYHPALVDLDGEMADGWGGQNPSNWLTHRVTSNQYSTLTDWGWESDPGASEDPDVTPDYRPRIRLDWEHGEAHHTFADQVAVRDAWAIVRRLDLRGGDRHADVLRYIYALWMANQDEVSQGRGMWVDAARVCEALGYTQHHKGGYRPQHLDEVADIIADLQLQVVSANVVMSFPRANSKKPAKRERLATSSPLILVKDTFTRSDLFHTTRAKSWLIEPGAWAIKSFELQPAFIKQICRALFAMDKQAPYAKRVGWELEQDWRTNAARRRTGRPFIVRELLRRAHIELPQANHTRFRSRFESQMDALRGAGVIARWEYPDGAITQGGAKGCARWLDARIVFHPPEVLQPELDKWAETREQRQLHRGRRAAARMAPSLPGQTA